MQVVDFLLHLVDKFGYFGIFLSMLFQNSIFPFAMEIVLLPAGFLAYKGEMSIYLVIFSAVLGQVIGGILNYFLAYYLKDKVLKFIPKDKFQNSKEIFNKSFFVGFFMPGVRAYLSLAAGFFRYNIFRVIFATFLASLFWVSIVALMGYFIGEDEEVIKQYISYITIGVVLFGIIYLKDKL